MNLFITGTDTGVGKTFTAVQLLRLLSLAGEECVGMKPICCGDRSDAELLLAAGPAQPLIDEINPVWLKTPASPLAATITEGRSIDLKVISDAYEQLRMRFKIVTVEGVGGWMVPVTKDYFVADLAVALGCRSS